MPDPLYLSLWFPNFETEDMLPYVLGVMRYFPFSKQRPGVIYLAVHPVSWSEPTVFEQRFNPGVRAEEAVLYASDLLHEDFAYRFEAYWDLWVPNEQGKNWELKPSLVTFLVHGLQFGDGVHQESGHVQVDFNLDAPFLHEDVKIAAEDAEHIRANVQMLVDFTTRVEKNSGATGRLLWSESEENLAQKLLNRLQKVQ